MFTFYGGVAIMGLQRYKEVDGMLLQFRFKNFRSFANEAVLDLTATNIKENISSLIEKNGVKVLPLAAIFGANASGKSNLFLAFKSMSDDVGGKYQSKRNPFITPYIFDKKIHEEPTEYEVCINIENKEYRYGFVRNQVKVFEEWLFCRNFSKNTKSKEKLIYYREGNNVTLGQINKTEAKELAFLGSMVTDGQLIMTALGQREKSIYTVVYSMFKFDLISIDFSDEMDENIFGDCFVEFTCENPELLKEAETLLNTIDPSIIGIEVKKEKDDKLNDIFKCYSVHLDSEGEKMYLPMESESGGTKKILAIALSIIFALKAGMIVLVDELDSKMHPLVLRYILQMFNNPEINVGKGQLIFSSHNLVCLDSSDLRRDEIWFVEKENQKSTLFSLYDFKTTNESIRSDLSFGKHYLAGRFGAIPFQNQR